MSSTHSSTRARFWSNQLPPPPEEEEEEEELTSLVLEESESATDTDSDSDSTGNEEEGEESTEEEEVEEEDGEGGEEGGDNGDTKEQGEEEVKGESVESTENSVVPNCPVCMEIWTSEGPHRVCCIPCGHVYGRLCLEKWLKRCGNKVGKCPQCNKKYKPRGIINLYAPKIVVPNDDLQKEVESLREKINSLNSESSAKDSSSSQPIPPNVVQAIINLQRNWDEKFERIKRQLDELAEVNRELIHQMRQLEASSGSPSSQGNSYGGSTLPRREMIHQFGTLLAATPRQPQSPIG